MTLAEPPGERTHWTCRAMAKAAGISHCSVQRIWAAHGLKPHRVRTFKLSNDPKFAAKVHHGYCGGRGLRRHARRGNNRQFRDDPGWDLAGLAGLAPGAAASAFSGAAAHGSKNRNAGIGSPPDDAPRLAAARAGDLGALRDAHKPAVILQDRHAVPGRRGI